MRLSVESSLMERARWALGAGLLALPLVSLLPLSSALPALTLLPVLVLALATYRPLVALALIGTIGPSVVPLTGLLGPAPFGGEATLEALVLAFVSGTCLHWAVLGAPRRGWLGTPAVVFGTITVASAVVLLSVQAVRFPEPTAFLQALLTHLSTTYFVDPRAFPAWHTAAIWVEALALAVVVERVIGADRRAAERLVTFALVGLALEGVWSVIRLVEVAQRSPDVLGALVHHALSTRLSPHFADINATGSLFAFGTVCWGLWVLHAHLPPRQPLARRVLAVTGFAVVALALWLTHSRAAQAATAVVGATAWYWRVRPSRRTLLFATAGVVSVGLLIGASGIVQVSRASPESAMRIRLDLARVGLAIGRDYPWFGVGAGAFQTVSAAYTSADLVRIFPVAAGGENAHNQFIQVFAELGLTGVAAFAWLWIAVFRRVRRTSTSRADAVSWVPILGAGLLAFLGSALLGHPFLTTPITQIIFLFVGLLAGLLPDPPDSGRTRRAWGALMCLAVAISVPWRIGEARRSVDLDNVIIGASRETGELDGIRYRSADGPSSWFVPSAARTIVIPVRAGTTGLSACRVAIVVDGQLANEVVVTDQEWRHVRIDVTTPGRSVSRRIDLRPDSCGLLIGRITHRP